MLNGANLYLVVNFVIAMSFASVFFAVAEKSRSRAAARWIGLGFAVSSLSCVAELLVAHTHLVKLSAILAFASLLAGLLLLAIGIAKLYGKRLYRPGLVAFFALSIAVIFALYDVPRSSLLHSLPYQLPFALVMLVCAWAVATSSHRAAVDRTLFLMLSLTSVHFVLKAFLSVLVGAGNTPSDYVMSNYAVISQGLTAILMVMAGLTLLAVLVLQIMADERSNSEVDALSGLFNRRGFEKYADRALVRAQKGPHSVILCDLDHFKRVNDTYGHYSGDSVIRCFGALLKAHVPQQAIVARLGGEEFGIVLPSASLESAMMLAHAVRSDVAVQSVPGLPHSFKMTASFGVSVFNHSNQLADALKLADKALYDAKGAGRNCVRHQSSPGFVSLAAG